MSRYLVGVSYTVSGFLVGWSKMGPHTQTCAAAKRFGCMDPTFSRKEVSGRRRKWDSEFDRDGDRLRGGGRRARPGRARADGGGAALHRGAGGQDPSQAAAGTPRGDIRISGEY